MPTIIIASQEARAGRTTVSAALGALLAEDGKSVRLARLRSPEGADAAAEDDARVFASVPGCTASNGAITEQDALGLARDAGANVLLIEAPAGVSPDLVTKLSARVVLVAQDANDVANAKASLGGALAGVVALPVANASKFDSKGVPLIASLPEDRLLAGPNVSELAAALHASRLVERGSEDEAVEYVMLGPISADPGQPYFLQHGSKAVLNRFDKMDLHLAALATEPDCLILTGGQMPSPYLLDRVAGSDFDVTVLLAPEGTVRAVELLDGLFGNTSFAGQRKLTRALERLRASIDRDKLASIVA
jgi:BioD-like phosphotransacetylase family protein